MKCADSAHFCSHTIRFRLHHFVFLCCRCCLHLWRSLFSPQPLSLPLTPSPFLACFLLSLPLSSLSLALSPSLFLRGRSKPDGMGQSRTLSLSSVVWCVIYLPINVMTATVCYSSAQSMVSALLYRLSFRPNSI